MKAYFLILFCITVNLTIAQEKITKTFNTGETKQIELALVNDYTQRTNYFKSGKVHSVNKYAKDWKNESYKAFAEDGTLLIDILTVTNDTTKQTTYKVKTTT